MDVDRPQLRRQLQAGLQALSLDLTPDTIASLLDYLQLLVKWNSAYNLSGIKDPGAMVSRHLLDSLAIAPFIDGDRVLDMGTGGGLPGIPLALCYPEKHFLLLDANGKKARFLFQVKTHLGLENVEIIQAQARDFQSREQLDIVLSRAFASLPDFVMQARHLLGTRGRLLAMKGQYPEEEVTGLPADFKVVQTHTLQVPGVNGARHLIEIRPHIENRPLKD